MLQALAPVLVSTLIKYGVDKITDKDDANFVEKTAKDLFGVVLDMNKPAAENAQLLEPYISKELNNLAELAMDKVTETIDTMPAEIANTTLLTLYGGYSTSAKAMVWFFALVYAAVCGVFTVEYLQTFEQMVYSDVMLFVLSCLFGLVAVAVLPVKAVAYAFTAIVGKVGAKKSVEAANRVKK